MFGQMMHAPLTISSLITHAERYHTQSDVISVETDGTHTKSSWGQIAQNARRLGSALTRLGLQRADRCGTIAWNNRRHLEIYFGVSGAGFVCHTLNPRLSPEQMTYVVNHAGNKVLFFDETFLPLVAKLAPGFTTVERYVLMTDGNKKASVDIPGLVYFDQMLLDGEPTFEWPELEENTASSLCYTSGTTGNPKGVLYSHRSTVLHSMASVMPDAMNISVRSTVLPVVPMFHVNAWGTPYSTALAGSRLVLPGPGLDGASLTNLIDTYAVTLALGVPTIWQGLLQAARKTGSELSSLKHSVVGGSACPPSMMKAFKEEFDVETLHAWGMTELSPLGTINRLLPSHDTLSPEERAQIRLGQGRPPFGIELRLVDDTGKVLPNDGKTQGNLVVRGPWVVDQYFKAETPTPLEDGFFPTGDIATLDANGYMIIRDRAKDIIKSGGEWISSVDIENTALGHPDLDDAAVFGVPHPKWDERPLLLAVKRAGANINKEDVLDYLSMHFPSWQIPDDVVFVDTLPRGATGKVLKNQLRAQYANHLRERVE